MRRGLACIVGLLAAACSPSEPESAGGGAAPDGTTTYGAADLLAWRRVGDANWREADGGAVQADSGNGFLVSPTSFRDFDLSVEFWVSPDANSGVFVRCVDADAPGAETCYEVNIFDQRPDPTYRTGSIVDVAPPSSTIYTGGRWNRFEITARGPRLQVVLNDRPMVDVSDERFAEGPVALQYGAGTVLFRNLRITTH
ncbi:MAG TPA: DUF1080 domain-containing protein [Gammaproteobacteria bacterium]